MKVELKEVEKQPMVKDGDYFRLITIDEHECYIGEEEYTLESLMEELDDLGLQRIVRSDKLKLIEL